MLRNFPVTCPQLVGRERDLYKYIPWNQKIKVLQSEKEREIFPQEELLTAIPKQRKWEIDGAASLLHNLIFMASLWKVGCQSEAVFSHKWHGHQFSLSDTNRFLFKRKYCAKPPQKRERWDAAELHLTHFIYWHSLHHHVTRPQGGAGDKAAALLALKPENL